MNIETPRNSVSDIGTITHQLCLTVRNTVLCVSEHQSQIFCFLQNHIMIVVASLFLLKVMLPRWVKNGFICYSKSKDGLYCLGCKFSPDTSGRRPKILVSEPYCNWKDAFADLKNHASCEYQLNSMMRLNSFRTSYLDPSCRNIYDEVIASKINCEMYWILQKVGNRPSEGTETRQVLEWKSGKLQRINQVQNWSRGYSFRRTLK